MVFSSALCLRKIHLSRNKNTKSTKCKIHSKDKFKSQVEGKQRTKASSAPSAPSAATIKNAKASHTLSKRCYIGDTSVKQHARTN